MTKKAYTLLTLLLLFHLGIFKLYGQVSIAHRGYSGEYPENTLLSFEKAILYGIEYIELDVRMSKDDSLMVIHDKTLDRTTSGKGLVEEFTFLELIKLDASYTKKYGNSFQNNKIPLLNKVLANFKGKVKFVIEAKNVSEVKIIDLVQKMNLEESAIISSYNEAKIKRISQNYKHIKTAFIVNRATSSSVEKALKIGADVLITSPYISKTTYRYALKNNIKVWFGIINSTLQIPSFVEKSNYGIISDFPNMIQKSIEVPFTTTTYENTIYIRPDDNKLEYMMTIFDISGNILFYREGVRGAFHTHLENLSSLFFITIVTKNGVYSFKHITLSKYY